MALSAPAFHAALRHPGTVWLDTAQPDAVNRHGWLFADPVRVLTAHTAADVPPLLDALDAALADGYFVAGYLSYEAGYALGPFESPTDGARLGWFGVYAERQAVPHTWLASLSAEADFSLENARFGLSRETYTEKIEQVRHHIQEGDVYQINFTGSLDFTFAGDPLALYQALRRKQQVAYGAVLHTGEQHLLCLSPELFFRRDGRQIVTRPMKGTVRRGRTLDEDAVLQAWLAADEKSRAENLMIVDLLRNDLSVVCEPGSVSVPALFTVEPYETLFQMTSTVTGTLREGVRYADLFRALFPCGSVTGAPKIRAMQLIRALEAGPRGVYCGAIGFAGPAEEAVFNVAIRTLALANGQGRMGTGSGIVWDSHADAEYDECLLKARFLTDPPTPPFHLIETMRAENGAIRLRSYHQDRLRDSAQYFGYSFDASAFDQHLQTTLAELPPTPHKIRLLLAPDGTLSVTTQPISTPPPGPHRVAFATQRVEAADPFFYHKTTRRDLYERTYAEAQARGLYEILFLNERGEVAEGTRTNVFIKKGNHFYTPPVASGLLPGVYRRHLLATLPHATERTLFPRDLLNADAVYLCNALTGTVPVTLVPSAVAEAVGG